MRRSHMNTAQMFELNLQRNKFYVSVGGGGDNLLNVISRLKQIGKEKNCFWKEGGGNLQNIIPNV